MRNASKILVRIPVGKTSLGRPNHRWEDSIGMDLRELRWEGMDWIHMAHDKDQWRALVYTVMNLPGTRN